MLNSAHTYDCKRAAKWAKLFAKLCSRFKNRSANSILEKGVNTYVCGIAFANYYLLTTKILDEKVWCVINKNCELIDRALLILNNEKDGSLADLFSFKDISRVYYKDE